ncbi:pyridoxamine 5'-phosphate oxidase family protein [Amycolatopsis arida]|nr:pyridoxamine 5'-phosphate oxidase family protein [Amycolatopsis arida]
MTKDERQAFLAERRIGVITMNRPERAPLAVPVWYGYEPGGDLVVWMEVGSLKDRLLREAKRFSFVVHRDEMPYQYVMLEGSVVAFDESPTTEEMVAIAARYFPEDEAKAYVDGMAGARNELVRMRPERWLTWDSSKDSWNT